MASIFRPLSMLSSFKNILRRLRAPTTLTCTHDKRDPDAWLTKHLPEGRWTPPPCKDASQILAQLRRMDARGKQPLWEGYQALGSYQRTDTTRTATEVSTFGPLGHAFAWLARERRPAMLVEVGTAFGLSGMYWLSGMEEIGEGHLLTFEPNELWAKQAQENLQCISERFTAVTGTFEEHIDRALPQGTTIDMALIDAIHTTAFVIPQFDAIAQRASAGALVIIDDIDFSDDMRSCWRQLTLDPRVRAAVSLGRAGILELHPSQTGV
jgi:predicted O-methyltransferase YrrM